jgi:hypothetical protein
MKGLPYDSGLGHAFDLRCQILISYGKIDLLGEWSQVNFK